MPASGEQLVVQPDEATSVPASSIYRPGDVVTGGVNRIDADGVWIYSGDTKAVLPVDDEAKFRFHCGDMAHGGQLEQVEPDGTLILSLEDPELASEETAQFLHAHENGSVEHKIVGVTAQKKTINIICVTNST